MLNSKSAEASYQCISQSENDFRTTAHQKSPPSTASTPSLPMNLIKQKNINRLTQNIFKQIKNEN
jgi:hypothetical protein